MNGNETYAAVAYISAADGIQLIRIYDNGDHARQGRIRRAQ